MHTASLEGVLTLEGHDLLIPLDASHYEWRQYTDARGRLRSKVRAGRWSFATSRLDAQQYEQLLALVLNPYLVVDAHAAYGRSDGQGTFVTVWGRRCTVCHVFSHFDSRGTQGQQPGWTIYFTLAAEEMGREAGAAGSFVLPEPGSYAYTPPAAVAGPVAAKPVGGRGPQGFGDTIGFYSGRPYDPETAGGPILQLNWIDARIEKTGIQIIKKHIARFGRILANEKMLARLEKIVSGTLPVTDFDKRYYTHELREYERYKAVGIPDGDNPSYEAWNDTHTATLEDYRINEETQPLYHPDITEEDFFTEL